MDDLQVPAGAFTGKNWTREQLKLAFYFYCQTPFGQLHGRNPQVIELATLIGRTPDALAMKCGNIASLDPAIRSSGRSGLGNASQLDREIWEEFHSDWERLAVECAQLCRYLERERGTRRRPSEEIKDSTFDLGDYTGETRKAIVAQRVKQSFFRRAVLSSYRSEGCISGVREPRLLVASHVVPWSESLSRILCARHNMTTRSMYAEQEEEGGRREPIQNFVCEA
jgi:putative restriction endonuclease